MIGHPYKYEMIHVLIFSLIAFMTASVSFSEENWKEYRGRHFLIYSNQAPPDFVKNVNEAAEREYEEITKNLGFIRYEGWSWNNRARIYIYDDRESYILAQNVSWSHGVALTKEKIIRTFPTASGFFDSTLPHELGHIIFREFIGYKSEIPLWFDEGVAIYQEKARRFGADKAVRQAISNGKFIPLEEINRKIISGSPDKNLVELVYAEAASVVCYLISEHGEYRFVNLCRQLKDGISFVDAVQKVYVRFNDIGDLNKSWMEYLSHE